MPVFQFEDEDGEPEPLFSEDDPLTFTLIDNDRKRREFRCVDEPILPRDQTGGIDSKPRSYLTELVTSQVVDGQQSDCAEVVDAMWDAGRINETKIMELLKFLGTEREKARKALTKRKTKRPTGASLHSLD